MAIANYKKACSANKPGNAMLAYTEVGSMTSFTITAGEVSAVTPEVGLTFHQFDADIDTIQVTSEGAGGSSYFQTNKIVAKFSKLSKELITAKQSLVDTVACGALAIVLDNNGQAWLVGYSSAEGFRRPLNKVTANFDSGAALADEGTSAYTITMEGTSGYDAIPFDTATNATIVAGTAAFITWN